MSRLWSQGSGVIRHNSHITMIKDHVANVKIYISFTRCLHDLQTERGSRDYTLRQIEDFDSPYRDTCHDLKNVNVDAVAPGKDNTWSITIITTTLSFQMTTLRLDARHRAKNTFSITIVNYGTGKEYYFKLTSGWSTRSFPSLCVDLTNVANDRSRTSAEERFNKIQYSDHVKSQYSEIFTSHIEIVVLLLSIKNSTDLSKLIHYFRDECWIEPYAHTSSSDSFWSSWALWPNWNENQIIINRSFKFLSSSWNEMRRTYLLVIKYIYIYILYIYIYVRRTRHWRDSQRRRRYIEEVDQEVLIRERVSKRCSSDIVVTRETYGRDRITSSRKRFLTQTWYPNDEKQRNYVSFKESVVDDSWRSGDFNMS